MGLMSGGLSYKESPNLLPVELLAGSRQCCRCPLLAGDSALGWLEDVEGCLWAVKEGESQKESFTAVGIWVSPPSIFGCFAGLELAHSLDSGVDTAASLMGEGSVASRFL